MIPKFNNDVLLSEFQMLLGIGLTWPPVPSSWTGTAGEPVWPDRRCQQPGGTKVKGKDPQALEAVRWASVLQQRGAAGMGRNLGSKGT